MLFFAKFSTKLYWINDHKKIKPYLSFMEETNPFTCCCLQCSILAIQSPWSFSFCFISKLLLFLPCVMSFPYLYLTCFDRHYQSPRCLTCITLNQNVISWVPLNLSELKLPFEMLPLYSFDRIDIFQDLGEELSFFFLSFSINFTNSCADVGSKPQESCPKVSIEPTFASSKRTVCGTHFHLGDFTSNTMHWWHVLRGSWWTQQVCQSSWEILWKELFSHCEIQWRELVVKFVIWRFPSLANWWIQDE